MGNIGRITDSQLGVGGDIMIAADAGTATSVIPGSTFTLVGGDGIETTVTTSSGNVVVTAKVGSPLTLTGNDLGMVGDLTLTSSTSDKPVVTLKNTNADANPATLDFIKDGGSPADDDELGEVVFNNDDSAGSQQFFAKLVGVSNDVTAGTLDGSLSIKVRQNQSVKTFTFGDGTYGLTLPDDTQAGILRYKTLSAYSDRALKVNIKPIPNALGKVLLLQGVEFDWKSGGESDIGLVAQDVREVIPSAVHGTDGEMGVDYAKLTALLVEALKELTSVVDRLQKVEVI